MALYTEAEQLKKLRSWVKTTLDQMRGSPKILDYQDGYRDALLKIEGKMVEMERSIAWRDEYTCKEFK